ncbi:hypothetical protein H0H87_004114 [Tephrocybe sp. NHM501043]|nr:hypothetical protein H0H87_004114 [Tephrocybe sp. NHM501043]
MFPQSFLDVGYDLLDKGLVPDFIVRRVIRALLRQRLREIDYGSFEANHAAKMQWIEQKYPNSRITGLSNSATQKAFIDSSATQRGLTNVTIITGDINSFNFEGNT